MKVKDEWRFAIIDGALSVMTCGTTMMLVLYVDNWDFLPPVCKINKHLCFSYDCDLGSCTFTYRSYCTRKCFLWCGYWSDLS